MDLLLQQIANGLVLGGAYVMVALGLFLVFSVLHLPNFAHGEMFALGAYLQYSLVVGAEMPFFIAILIVVAVVAVVGIILERSVFRRLQSSNTLAVLVGSLALAIVLQEIISLTWGVDPLAVPAPISGSTTLGLVTIADYRLVIIAVTVGVALAVGWLVYRTAFGRSMRALAQNREIASLAGLDVPRIGTMTFVLGAAIAGLAGALLAPTVNLEPHMGFHPTLVAFVILVIIGGGGKMQSVVWGGFIIATVETLAAGYISNDLRNMVVFIALVLFLSLRPDGAFRQASVLKAQL